MFRTAVIAALAAVLAAPAAALTVTQGASAIVGEGAGAPGDLSVYTVEVLPGAASLYGFGVTSPDTTVLRVGPPVFGPPIVIGSEDAFGEVSYDGTSNFDFWTGWIIDQTEWPTFEPISGPGVLAPGTTLEDLFGGWSFGTEVVNWYQLEDGFPAGPEVLAEGFFFNGTPNSTALTLVLDDQMDVSTDVFALSDGDAGGAAVPLPGALVLLGAGLAGLAALRALRRA